MRNLLIILFLFSVTSPVLGQDVLFSQFSNQTFLFNPALSGFEDNNLLTVSNRDQWRNNSKSLSTTAISYNKYLPWQIKKKSPIVLNTLILSDNFSSTAFKRNQVVFTITSIIQLNKNICLGTALYTGVMQHTFNFNKFKWGTQYNGFIYDPTIDSQEGFSKESFVNFDCGVGIVANLRGGYTNYKEKKLKASVGYALYHVNSPRYTIDKEYEDEYSRKVYFANVAGRLFNNFRWMYMLLVNKQGPDLLIMTGGECRYLMADNSSLIKSVAFETYSCYNKSYFLKKNQSSFIAYNLYFNFNRISMGLTYETGLSSSTKRKSYTFKAIECSIKYKLLRDK